MARPVPREGYYDCSLRSTGLSDLDIERYDLDFKNQVVLGSTPLGPRLVIYVLSLKREPALAPSFTLAVLHGLRAPIVATGRHGSWTTAASHDT